MQELNANAYASTGLLPSDSTDTAILLQVISSESLNDFVDGLNASDQQWLQRQSFTGKAGQVAWLENGQGVIGSTGADSLSTLGHLPYLLPEGVYRLTDDASFIALLGWGLGSYRFDRYKQADRQPAQLILPDSADAAELVNTVAASNLARDLINTPAQDMAPSHLQAEVEALAETFDCRDQHHRR
jgi:leucyl aminopeptidase